MKNQIPPNCKTTATSSAQVVEQLVERQSRINSRLAGIKHILAIGSGKGGVGKSTLCMELALAFRAKGLEVGVLDADFNGPSIVQLAGLANPAVIPSETGFFVPRTKDGIRVLSTGLFLAPAQSLEFFSFADGESFTWRATKEFSTLAEMLAAADWGDLDILLVDLPPGPERTVQFVEFLGECCQLLLVTIPSDLSLQVVNRALAALAGSKVSSERVLGVVENMKGYWQNGQLLPLFPEQVKHIGVEKLGQLPFDPELAALCDRGLSVSRLLELPSGKLLLDLAEVIEGRLVRGAR